VGHKSLDTSIWDLNPFLSSDLWPTLYCWEYILKQHILRWEKRFNIQVEPPACPHWDSMKYLSGTAGGLYLVISFLLPKICTSKIWDHFLGNNTHKKSKQYFSKCTAHCHYPCCRWTQCSLLTSHKGSSGYIWLRYTDASSEQNSTVPFKRGFTYILVTAM
jgi:hypothetical protein